MPPPSRTRRILKWIGGVSSIAFLIGWIASNQFELWWVESKQLAVSISDGTVYLMWVESPGIRNLDLFVFDMRVHGEWPTGLLFEFRKLIDNRFVTLLVLPLWLPLLFTAIPTAWLFHRDRRRIPPGHCLRCGYDLTGNTSGVCSECGTPVAAAAAAAPEQPSGR